MYNMNFDIPLGCGNVYAPRKKMILDGAIAGAINAAASSGLAAQQHAYTKEQMRLQARLNNQQVAYSQGLQNAQQNWLMNTQYGKMASGMKNAGLNPATANGTSVSTPSAGHGSAGPAGPSAGIPNVDIAHAMLVGEQWKAQRIQNKRDEIKLKDEEEASKEGYSSEKTYLHPETGVELTQDEVDKWEESDYYKKSGLLPELVVSKRNRGRDIEQQAREERETQTLERNARSANAKLDTAIRTGQLKDQDVMDAFIELPANERKTLEKVWREYDDTHDLAKLQKDLQKLQNDDFKASSFGSLVNSLKDKDLSFGDKLFAMLGFVFNRLTNNTGLNFSFGRKGSSGPRSQTTTRLYGPGGYQQHTTYE